MVHCPKCGHTWTPRSTSPRLTCSRCGTKFTRLKPLTLVLGRNVPLHTYCDVCGIACSELYVCRVDGDACLMCEPCVREATGPRGEQP